MSRLTTLYRDWYQDLPVRQQFCNLGSFKRLNEKKVYVYSSSFFLLHTDHERTLEEYSRIVTRSIETQRLQIGDTIYAGDTILTPRHDIGYHFELEDDEEVYEEGNNDFF